MGIIDKSDSDFNDLVATTGSSIKSQTPANGDKWVIKDFKVGASSSAKAWVELVWDDGGAGEEILYSSSSSIVVQLDKEITGDGTKKLSIRSYNECDRDHVMGGAYTAFKVE